MKMAVILGAAKYVVGLLWHSSIWNFLMKNKEKNQAHEELEMSWKGMLFPTITFDALKITYTGSTHVRLCFIVHLMLHNIWY